MLKSKREKHSGEIEPRCILIRQGAKRKRSEFMDIEKMIQSFTNLPPGKLTYIAGWNIGISPFSIGNTSSNGPF